MKIDCIRTSASRPDLLKISTYSMLSGIRFEGKFRYLLHEDFLRKDYSEECVKWAEESKVFDIILEDDPPIRQGSSLWRLYNNTKTEFILNWEDDWELIKPLDFNEVVGVMKENKDVNQICFHKRPIMSEKPGFVKKEVIRSGMKLTTNPHWAFLPALWRRSFIDKFMYNFEGSNTWGVIEKIRPWPTTADYIIKNVGTYYWGGIEQGHYVKHLGHMRSVRTGEMQKEWENK